MRTNVLLNLSPQSPEYMTVCVKHIGLKIGSEKTWRATKQLTLTACDIQLSCFYTRFIALMRAASYYQRSGRLLTIFYNLVLGGRISVPPTIYECKT